MKKQINLYVIFIFFLLIGGSALYSQGIHDKGIKLGVNLSYARGDDAKPSADETRKFRTGFIGGLFFNYQINQIFSIQPELYYTMQGVDYILDQGADFDDFKIKKSKENIDIKYKQSYIQIPIFLKCNLIPSNLVLQPNVLIGPSIGFLVNSQVEEGSNNIDLYDDTNKIDFGIVFCGELVFQKFIFDMRYNLGIINVPSDLNDWKNSVFSILVGLRL